MDYFALSACFEQMEQDLCVALKQEVDNRLENDAKIRAVSQNVTYEEFK